MEEAASRCGEGVGRINRQVMEDTGQSNSRSIQKKKTKQATKKTNRRHMTFKSRNAKRENRRRAYLANLHKAQIWKKSTR